jgi:hypothetical protein
MQAYFGAFKGQGLMRIKRYKLRNYHGSLSMSFISHCRDFNDCLNRSEYAFVRKCQVISLVCLRPLETLE